MASVRDRPASNTDEHAQLDHVVEHDGLSSTALKTGYSFDNKPDYADWQENPLHRDYHAKLLGIRSPTVRGRFYTLLCHSRLYDLRAMGRENRTKRTEVNNLLY